jgi:o-succinylbenzoate synthase
MGLIYKTLTLDFIKPLATSTGVIKSREILILEWVPQGLDEVFTEFLSDVNKFFYAEAAPLPLPDFSFETAADCTAWLDQNKSSLEEYLNQASIRYVNSWLDKFETIRDNITRFFESESALCPVPEALPSLRFACDSLLLSLILQRSIRTSVFENEDNLWQPVPVNALISDDNLIELLVLNGFQTFKFKVGVNPESELKKLKFIRSNYPDIQIRLDANGGWTTEEAQLWVPKFSELNIEYLEQPVGRDLLFTYCGEIKSYGIPIAADESLRNLADFGRFGALDMPDFAIIKPMIINGLHQTFSLIDTCLRFKVQPVITSTLESGLTRRTLAKIASIFKLFENAHGLATGSLLANDPYDDTKLIKGGFYHMEKGR